MRVGLGAVSAKMPHQLSGGEQQRVVIARAMINEPQILFADEPTGNLDPDVSEGIIKLFEEINNSGTAVLMATHNHRFIEKFPHRVLKCEKGKILDSSKEKFELSGWYQPFLYLHIMGQINIYGAYGYTGRLIVDECIAKGLKPVIAGRNPEKTEAFEATKQLEFSVFDVDETEKVQSWLKNADILIHCGGPFIHTAREMVEACLETNTHYLDITGEYQVFDLIKEYDKDAQVKNLMLMPGAGFDVVPSDCLAAYLKKHLPTATDLQLAFVSKGGALSRGTTKTMIENLGEPQVVRKDGKYHEQLMGSSTKKITFGEFEQLAMGISWGDVSTAFTSTGIRNIEVFTGTTAEQVAKVNKMGRLSFLLKSSLVKNFLMGRLDKKPDGPKDEKRESAKMYMWGKVSDGKESIEARLTTPNGYTLTAKTAVLIAQKILAKEYKNGYQTPSTAYGENLILEIEGCEGFNTAQ